MRNLIIILTIPMLMGSCNESPEYTKKYIVYKSDDNNWTTSGVIECDSVSMEGQRKAILWVDGQKMIIESDLIKIYSNRHYSNQ